jgi:hypothetical protein
MSLSLSALVQAVGSRLPAVSATLQAVCTAPGGHVLHFWASVAHGPDCGCACGAAAAAAVAVVVAVAVAVEVAVEAADGADDGESLELLLQGPAMTAMPSKTIIFMGAILRHLEVFQGS